MTDEIKALLTEEERVLIAKMHVCGRHSEAHAIVNSAIARANPPPPPEQAQPDQPQSTDYMR